MKPSILKGTRDFLPSQVYKRNYIFGIIKSVFEQYGFLPIETPVMEHLSTLTGKYGEEGDKLIFKLLNNGDFLAKANEEALTKRDSNKLISSISKRGLRYDLTVPFARFVVMHQNDLSFPFKRYQMQPVWRADRPQKGRYQEFYQCDADAIGSNSLMYEAELIQIFDKVFDKLGMDVTIRINNRKILKGIADEAGLSDQFQSMTVALDKLDKIGEEGVRKDMSTQGFSDASIDKVFSFLNNASLDTLQFNSEDGQKGQEELMEVFSYLGDTNNTVELDMTLARGLNYYTGFIIEVISNDVAIGSIGGGGRYDDLTGVFGLKDMSGVGISFGLARIFDVMEELDLFPATTVSKSQIIFLCHDEASHRYAFKQVTQLRSEGLCADIYPAAVKMKKQMKYANDRGFPYVVIVGETEVESNTLSFKDMTSGTQELLSLEEVKERLS